MAGHNKWSKIKRQKAKEDKKKSKIWARLSREIATAAREGGGDPDMNATLAQAIERAEAENMAKDTIERAIKRGTGELEGQNYEPASYEGYAPHGVAVFIEAMTDNTNRTVADLRHLFKQYDGNLGKDGSVGYLFEQKGQFEIPVSETDELELFELVVDAGAEDLQTEGDVYVVTSSVDAFSNVESALEDAGIETESADLVRIPATTVALDESQTETVRNLIEQIEDHDDVDAVYTTLDVNGEALALDSDE
ncbi:YebC/PmpR family DNA-binding transcriptional regulator [Longibacter salinarum]|uniref:Probable transcriptional regulatory protein CRI94_14460 n=1 Tax=Longibacter salinarum TaxID=1850348 RepID=A0A2A8CUL8_9BACT|nr:YebC/PmpR family DNA-binding transcriptional regulator [Longibacter salinarum]PEN12239.1 YebC/PmpR family DNA-binding transcriptional regulator [Longibacter salinarum]